MKKILIAFCIAFTIIVLLTSFTPIFNSGSSHVGRCTYVVDEVVVNGQKYVVATTTNGGIAICKQ